MAKTQSDKAQKTRGVGVSEVETAQAEKAGAAFDWHYGRITRMGPSEMAGPGVTSQQGNISDEEWVIFKLAFKTTGRIAVLSDQQGDAWMYDYRFIEAVR